MLVDFDRKELLDSFKPLYRLALREDIPTSDVTSELVFSDGLSTGYRGSEKSNQLILNKKTPYKEAVLFSKAKGVIAGMFLAEYIFADKKIKYKALKQDGDKIEKGSKIFLLEGDYISILGVERIVLNLLQKLSGIASYTRLFVSKLAGTKIKILDTRKTTLGHRYLEKYSVKIGGGENHRFSLSDEYLIKDNHIDFLGSLEKVFQILKFKEKKKLTLECRSVDEALLAAKYEGIDQLLLDNFSLKQLKKAVPLIREEYKRNKRKIKIEISGGVNLKNIEEFKGLDIDYISVGALTHSAPILDLSLTVV